MKKKSKSFEVKLSLKNYLPFFLVVAIALVLWIARFAFANVGIASTNDRNKSLGYPYVVQGVTTTSTMAFKFINPMNAQKCFEYRIDGDPDKNQAIGTISNTFLQLQSPDPNTSSYPTVCVPANSNVSKTLNYSSYVEIRLYDESNLDGSFYWARFDWASRPQLPVSKDDCQADHWTTYGVFNNQGDCMSYVNETKNLNK